MFLFFNGCRRRWTKNGSKQACSLHKSGRTISAFKASLPAKDTALRAHSGSQRLAAATTSATRRVPLLRSGWDRRELRRRTDTRCTGSSSREPGASLERRESCLARRQMRSIRTLSSTLFCKMLPLNTDALLVKKHMQFEEQIGVVHYFSDS